MTDGYIDMAAMNSALAVLEEGKDCTASRWHWDNLVEVTYFLMWDNFKVAPGTRRPGPASGTYEHVVREFPHLPSTTEHQEEAKQKTIDWLNSNKDQLSTAWQESIRDSDFLAWVEFQRDIFWVRHSNVYGAICEEEWVPYIAETLNVKEKEIRDIQRNSQETEVVKGWLKSRRQSVTPGLASLAEDVWVVGGMIRGKYHEYIAADHGQQLLQHQFRKVIQRKLPEGELQLVSTSEELFTKLIVRSALDGKNKDQRVATWAKYTKAARDVLIADPNAIREANTEGGLDHILRTAADRAGVRIEKGHTSKILDSVLEWKVPSLVGYALSLWIPQADKVGSIIEKITSRANKAGGSHKGGSSKSKYEAVDRAKSIPGRIERRFKQE